MKYPHDLALALLLSVLLGCARTPVSPAPRDSATEAAPPARVVAGSVPAPDQTTEPLPLPQPARRDNPEIIKTKESGIIRGIVLWEGAESVRPTPRLRIDSTTHGIAQAVVRLLSTRKAIAPNSAESVRLVVERGEYRPHVVLTQKGSMIELRSVEDRADFQASGAATFSATIQRGEKRVFPLSSPGLVEVRSQLRPDRTPAYVWVLDGSPGALTRSDGTFRLPPAPPGEYELALWHEDWHASESAPPCTAQVRIKLEPGEGVQVRWILAER